MSSFGRLLAVVAALWTVACGGGSTVVDPGGNTGGNTGGSSGGGAGGGGGGGSTTKATVRFVNATTLTFDFLTGGTVATGNGALAFGVPTSCLSVEAATPGLSVRITGTTNTLTNFAPVFTAGGTYLVVAVKDVNNLPAFITLSGTFTPQTGQAGLRVSNTTTFELPYDIYLTAPAGPLVSPVFTNLRAGTTTDFASVVSGSRQIRVTQTASPVVYLDAGLSLTAGQSYTFVIGEPRAGSTSPPGALIPSC